MAGSNHSFCDSQDEIIIGHLRRAPAKGGDDRVPGSTSRIILRQRQVRGLRLMDNRSHEEAGWDFELLGLELIDLDAWDSALELTGFDEQELTRAIMHKDDGLTDP